MPAKKKRHRRIEDRLATFAAEQRVRTKGPLSVVLVITRAAKDMTTPFTEQDFLTPQGGQVAGLGRSAVQAILSEYDITRVLADEGGRTSRGSIGKMRAYVEFLNLLANDNLWDFHFIEAWWIGRVKEFFTSKPLKLKVDASKSLRRIVGQLMESAFERQRECPGTMVAGAVLQHLVGAKLDIALPECAISHNGFSVADAPLSRKGDFVIGDTAIHVTTAPGEALIRKCCDNLEQSIRPIIVTTDSGAGGAAAIAKNFGIADRLDILEVEQFIATNIYEWTGFASGKRTHSVGELIERYNEIVEQCETDPSLKISIG